MQNISYKYSLFFISGPVTKCSTSACANRGICVQMWNSYTCDCDMTSYTGPTCSDGKLY